MAIGLTIQPSVLEGITSAHPEMRDRGLLPRFLFGLPSITAPGQLGRIGYREIDPPTASEETREAFRTFIQRHAEQRLPEDGPVPLRTDEQASATFSDWRRQIEPQRRPEGEHSLVQAWSLKLEGQTLRLAGLLHLAWGAASLEMSLLTTGRGCLMRATEVGPDGQTRRR